MNVQQTEPYRRAWKNYELAGHDVTRLSAADVAALRADPVTRRNMDAPRPVEITSRTTTTKAAAAIDSDALASELVDAVAAALHTGNTEAVHHVIARQVTQSPKVATLMVVTGMRAALHALHASRTREAALEARVKALEAAPSKSVEYTGVWNQETVYAVGNACTHAGSLWIAKSANVSRRPGGPDGCWTLACKRGADGKNGECKCAAGDKVPQ